jgi:predicted RNase H-related nuclease YkuK (DUF458 family)
MELDTENPQNVAGAICEAVLNVKQLVVTKQLRLTGFSFHRKFEIHLKINEREYVTMASVNKVHNILGYEQKSELTIQNKPESVERFITTIFNIVRDEMAFKGKINTPTIDEVRKASAKLLNA